MKRSILLALSVIGLAACQKPAAVSEEPVVAPVAVDNTAAPAPADGMAAPEAAPAEAPAEQAQ